MCKKNLTMLARKLALRFTFNCTIKRTNFDNIFALLIFTVATHYPIQNILAYIIEIPYAPNTIKGTKFIMFTAWEQPTTLC